MASPAGKLMLAFKDYVDTACGKCKHIKYCRGGCPYNAMAPTPGRIEGVDPHCVAYTRIFDEIGDRLEQGDVRFPADGDGRLRDAAKCRSREAPKARRNGADAEECDAVNGIVSLQAVEERRYPAVVSPIFFKTLLGADAPAAWASPGRDSSS